MSHLSAVHVIICVCVCVCVCSKPSFALFKMSLLSSVMSYFLYVLLQTLQKLCIGFMKVDGVYSMMIRPLQVKEIKERFTEEKSGLSIS